MTQITATTWGVDPAAFRFSAYLCILVIMMTAETLWPRRTRSQPRSARWPGNLIIAGINAFLTKLAAPLGGLAMAALAESHSWGLFHLWVLPAWLSLGASLILLDLVIYWQHRLFHSSAWLWRAHRMHHADVDLDITSGSRFHPMEVMISMVVKASAVLLLGAPVVSVFLFEVVLNGAAMFNHSNLRLPPWIDRLLRLVLVTPDMHRVHHSTQPTEMNRNFGFNLPWWDWMFGTYQSQPEQGHDGMRIGLDGFQDPKEARISALLTQPFRNPPATQTVKNPVPSSTTAKPLRTRERD